MGKGYRSSNLKNVVVVSFMTVAKVRMKLEIKLICEYFLFVEHWIYAAKKKINCYGWKLSVLQSWK